MQVHFDANTLFPPPTHKMGGGNKKKYLNINRPISINQAMPISKEVYKVFAQVRR